MPTTFSQTTLLSGLGSSCSQALSLDEPSQTVGSGLNTRVSASGAASFCSVKDATAAVACTVLQRHGRTGEDPGQQGTVPARLVGRARRHPVGAQQVEAGPRLLIGEQRDDLLRRQSIV